MLGIYIINSLLSTNDWRNKGLDIDAYSRAVRRISEHFDCCPDQSIIVKKQGINHPSKTFVGIYDEHFSGQYGFWRPYVEQVIYRYLDCGDLLSGVARVKCKDCGRKYLLAFSCKRRHFCPSCHQKRLVEFGEWLCMDVLKKIPHRHFVFSIPKIIRRYFLGRKPKG